MFRPVGIAWEDEDGEVGYEFKDKRTLEEMFESLTYECPENNKPLKEEEDGRR